MDSKERFHRTLNRESVDRPAWWLGLPTAEALPALYRHFSVANFAELKNAVNDDIWTIDLPYENGTTNAVSMAFDFAKEDLKLSYSERTLTSPGFFEDYEDIQDFGRFDRWPDPEKYIHRSSCEALLEQAPPEKPILGILWSAHFQDACAAFGMQDALIKMKIAPELFRAVIDRIVQFYLRANELFFEYTKGKIDAVLIGNDFGTQTGLIVSGEDLREFVFPGTKLLIEQAHSYGVKVIHHSCGAIRDVIPDLISCGADAIHPIQALAKGLEPNSLKQEFGDRISFAGGVDAQQLLVNGTPENVRRKVFELREIFPTGLVISPSHEAILPDIPPENVRALSDAMKEVI